MSHLTGKTVVVVGGGSGIGKAVVAAAAKDGARMVLSSRSRAKLDAAAKDIPSANVIPVDITNAASVAEWQAALPEVDHLVISASSAAHGRFEDLPETDLRAMFEAKFFGPYAAARAALPKLQAGGSITFFSGVLSRRPGLNCSGLGAVNSAVEGLARALALELGPRVRVNCISPGMIRSDAYAGMREDARETMYAATGDSLPVGRVGTVEEAAEATLFVMSNTYTSGLVLDVDGGHMIRQ